MPKTADGSGTAAPTAVGAAMVSGLPNGTVVTPSDHGPGSAALIACTVNVYVVPLVSPVTWSVVVAPRVVICGCPAGGGLTSTEYPVMGLPLPSGACQVSATVPSPGVAVSPVTWLGSPKGTAVAVALAGPVPALLIALTSTVYGVPLVSPVTGHGEAAHWCLAPLA